MIDCGPKNNISPDMIKRMHKDILGGSQTQQSMKEKFLNECKTVPSSANLSQSNVKMKAVASEFMR